MSRKPDCNICGETADQTVEFGTVRGESGTIGLSMCRDCWDAAAWHDEHAPDRCFSCGDADAKAFGIAQPDHAGDGSDVTGYDLSLCRDCQSKSGGLLSAWDTDVGFRAKANIISNWESQRNAALFRDDYTCQDCGDDEPWLHVHHKIPRSEGGTDHIDNLVSLCPDCHAERHNTDACTLCGSVAFTEDNALWIDESGGAPVSFCEQCVEYIKRTGNTGERCAVCGRFRSPTAKSDGIYFAAAGGEGDSPPIYAGCDECRTAAVFKSRAEKQQYFDEELPDSHADIRHWEVTAE
jgi:hypothetical protein